MFFSSLFKEILFALSLFEALALALASLHTVPCLAARTLDEPGRINFMLVSELTDDS